MHLGDAERRQDRAERPDPAHRDQGGRHDQPRRAGSRRPSYTGNTDTPIRSIISPVAVAATHLLPVQTSSRRWSHRVPMLYGTRSRFEPVPLPVIRMAVPLASPPTKGMV